MALTKIDTFKYLLIDSDENDIEDKWCRYFTMIDWPKLRIFNLANNKISSHGVKHIVKANWSYLKVIKLGIF